MKAMKTLDDLGNHPFTERCFDNALRVNKELGDSKPFSIEPSWKRVPYEEEYYQLTVGAAVATLLNACQQLSDSVLYLSSFTPSTRMKKQGLNRQRHIQFCIESYIVRAQSIYDKLLVLVEAVFHLGIADECINYNLIVTNIHVKMSGIDERLKTMSKLRNRYLYVRNTI